MSTLATRESTKHEDVTLPNIRSTVSVYGHFSTASHHWVEVAHFGCVPVGVVDTCVVTLVDPLPEDHLLEGLVWEEQANHLHWEGRGGAGEGRARGGEGRGRGRGGGGDKREEEREGEGRWRGPGASGGGGSTNSEDGARRKRDNVQMVGLELQSTWKCSLYVLVTATSLAHS